MIQSSKKLSVVLCLGILVVCLGMLVTFSSTPALAQSSTGSISGVVTDPSGAAIVGAEVKLVDTSTNTTQSATTNEVGRYTFVSVSPGVYNVSVAHTGFTQAKIQGQKVDVGATLNLNMTLQLGATSTVVEVQAQA